MLSGLSSAMTFWSFLSRSLSFLEVLAETSAANVGIVDASEMLPALVTVVGFRIPPAFIADLVGSRRCVAILTFSLSHSF